MFIKPIRDFNRTIIFVSNLRIQFQFKYNLIIKKKNGIRNNFNQYIIWFYEINLKIYEDFDW